MPTPFPDQPTAKGRSTHRPSAPDPVGQLSDLKLDIVYVDLADVRGYDRNARVHSDRQITQLAASIKTFGFVVPVVLDETDTLVAGHGRVAAARQLGMNKIPVIRLSHLDKASIQALRIADNRLAELSSFDADLLSLELDELSNLELDFSLEVIGFSTGELDIILDGPTEKTKIDPADNIPPLEERAVSQSGDLWMLGEHRLVCGSALDPEVLRRVLDGKLARTVFTDPPYNVKVSGHMGGLGQTKHREFAMASGEMSELEFVGFLSASLGNMADCMIDGGVMFACMDWRHMHELLTASRALGLTELNLCVWVKTNAGMGSFFRSQHELVLVCKKGKAPHQNLVELGKHGRYRSNVWTYAGVNTFKTGRMDELAMHPSVKPTSLVADAIRDCTRRGELVLDAFGGSGTTIIAAQKSGRRAACVEIDPLYVDVAILRWEKLTGKQAVHCDTGQSFAEVAQLRASQEQSSEAAVTNMKVER